ncbi:MAG: LysM peptidoglycan-binding domain-containing protein [Anaerolineae bacterium]|nr:LysM peptidoglycan-binding domain-containing protein [Anaerolineae bacterium]
MRRLAPAVATALVLLAAGTLPGCGAGDPGRDGTSTAPRRPAASGTATTLPTWTDEPVTPTSTATPTATPTPIVYAIQQGDTLVEVAARFGVSASEIQEVNGITDPRLLQIGQEIIIPAASGEGDRSTPTPTPMPVHVSSQADVRTQAGLAVVLGEVVNDSPQGVEEVTVQVELQDGSGSVLASITTAAMADVIAGGGRAPFAVVIGEAPPYQRAVARVIRALPEVPARLVHQALSVAESTGRAVYDRTFVVMGKVRNLGEETALDVFVVVTLYGRDGAVIGAGREPLEPVPPGSRAVFQVSLVPIAWPVENYEVTVEGRRPTPTPLGGRPIEATPSG